MDSVTAEYFINSCCEKIDCRAENALYNKKQQLLTSDHSKRIASKEREREIADDVLNSMHF